MDMYPVSARIADVKAMFIHVHTGKLWVWNGRNRFQWNIGIMDAQTDTTNKNIRFKFTSHVFIETAFFPNYSLTHITSS